MVTRPFENERQQHFVPTPQMLSNCTNKHCTLSNSNYMIVCKQCTKPTHFVCTRLPAYQLFSFTRKKRVTFFKKRKTKYVCESCCGGVPNVIMSNSIEGGGSTEGNGVGRDGALQNERCKKRVGFQLEDDDKNEHSDGGMISHDYNQDDGELRELYEMLEGPHSRHPRGKQNENVYFGIETETERKMFEKTTLLTLESRVPTTLPTTESYEKNTDEEILAESYKNELEELRQRLHENDKTYEHVLGKNEKLINQLTSRNKYLIDWLWKVLQYSPHTTNNEHTQTDVTMSDHDVIDDENIYDVTVHEHGPWNGNELQVMRLTNLETHQGILRAHIVDLKKTLAVKEKERHLQIVVIKELLDKLTKRLSVETVVPDDHVNTIEGHPPPTYMGMEAHHVRKKTNLDENVDMSVKDGTKIATPPSAGDSDVIRNLKRQVAVLNSTISNIRTDLWKCKRRLRFSDPNFDDIGDDERLNMEKSFNDVTSAARKVVRISAGTSSGKRSTWTPSPCTTIVLKNGVRPSV